jgi:hypothetical protein
MGDSFDGKLKPSLASQLNNLKNQGRIERERVSIALQRRGTDDTGVESTGGGKGATFEEKGGASPSQDEASPFQRTSSREALRAMLHGGAQVEDSARRNQSVTSFEVASPDVANREKDAKAEQPRPLYNSLQVDVANLLVNVSCRVAAFLLGGGLCDVTLELEDKDVLPTN